MEEREKVIVMVESNVEGGNKYIVLVVVIVEEREEHTGYRNGSSGITMEGS